MGSGSRGLLGKVEGTGFTMSALTVCRSLCIVSKRKDEHRGGFDLVWVSGGVRKVNETLNKKSPEVEKRLILNKM